MHHRPLLLSFAMCVLNSSPGIFFTVFYFNFPIYNLSCYVRLGFDLLTRIRLHIIDRVYSYLYFPKYSFEYAFGKRNFGQVRNFCLFF